MTNNHDLLYACGRNKYGQLGVGSYVAQNTPTIVKNFQGSEILTFGGLTNDIQQTNSRDSGIFPTKIRFPGFFTNYLDSKDMIRIACSLQVCFLYLDFNNTICTILGFLFETKNFCDCEIGTLGNQIPVHKILVECRFKLTIDQIQNKLFVEKSINKEQTLNFLKWIYYDEISEIWKNLNKLLIYWN
ncbi:btk-binding protein-related [Anaeramoeba flamelloides]|uniref:Btk-binding protein-related n=1 Tax=Anaeramoeba flamelloides TaxID=1746091 RepID=A0AAV7YAJ1_9EUKA|nr:btk-binding protein-related [Anaeramoeba flamelloides]